MGNRDLPIPPPLSGEELEALDQLLDDLGTRPGVVASSWWESMAVYLWRLERRLDALQVQGDSDRAKRPLRDSLHRLTSALEQAGVTIEDPIERGYTDGWIELDVIAWEDPDSPPPPGVGGPWVKQTIKPIVRARGRLLARGEVVIADTATDPPEALGKDSHGTDH